MTKPSLRALMETVKDRRQLATPLNARERAALKVAEATIEEHIGAWVNVSNALLEINQSRLYRETHATFEDYMRERWGLSRSRGHRLVLHAGVLMSPVGDRISNERQAREIAAYLDDTELLEQIVERAEEIQAGRPLTAKALRQARLELTVTPEQAEDARAIYRFTEFTAEAQREWQERALRYVGHLYDSLPPAQWPEAHAAVQAKPPQSKQDVRECFLSMLTKLAFDAPLTTEMAQFLREGCKVIDTAPIELFTKSITNVTRLAEMPVLKLMEAMVAETRAAPEDSEITTWINDTRVMCSQASATAAGELSARMSEVVQAVAMAPALPPHEWTAVEIEAGLEQFYEGQPWPDGSLRQDTRKLMVTMLAFHREVGEQIIPAEVLAKHPGTWEGIPRLAELVPEG